jgi:integrase
MAASGSTTDTRHLERHGKQYRAKLDVPRKLREIVGKAALKKGLGTDSLTEAQRLRWAAVADLRKQLHEIIRRASTALDPIVAEAMEYRIDRGILVDVAQREERPMDVEILEMFDSTIIDGKAEEIELAYHPAKAKEFLGIVRGERTPLTVFIDQWITDLDGHVKPRTLKHYADAVRHLAAFATEHGLPQTIEAFDRRHAGDFITNRFIAPKAKYKTARKYVSALSSYWRWLNAKGKLPRGTDNPWRDQAMPPKSAPKISSDGTIEDTEPREFTDEEVARLLHTGKPNDLVLVDFMHVAALSGMRREEIARIRVRDVDLLALTINLPRAKTKAGIRAVPLHPDLCGIFARRTLGKPPSAWLFPELPEDTKERLAERADEVGKRFVTYRRGLGIDDRRPGEKRSRVDFHSFRRWFVTKAEQAGVPDAIIGAVVGHKTARGGMTLGVYSGGPSLAQRRACVEAVKLPSKPNG